MFGSGSISFSSVTPDSGQEPFNGAFNGLTLETTPGPNENKVKLGGLVVEETTLELSNVALQINGNNAAASVVKFGALGVNEPFSITADVSQLSGLPMALFFSPNPGTTVVSLSNNDETDSFTEMYYEVANGISGMQMGTTGRANSDANRVFLRATLADKEWAFDALGVPGFTFRMNLVEKFAIGANGISTEDPGGGAGAWRLGQVTAAAVALDATQYVEVMIDGVLLKLALVN